MSQGSDVFDGHAQSITGDVFDGHAHSNTGDVLDGPGDVLDGHAQSRFDVALGHRDVDVMDLDTGGGTGVQPQQKVRGKASDTGANDDLFGEETQSIAGEIESQRSADVVADGHHVQSDAGAIPCSTTLDGGEVVVVDSQDTDELISRFATGARSSTRKLCAQASCASTMLDSLSDIEDGPDTALDEEVRNTVAVRPPPDTPKPSEAH